MKIFGIEVMPLSRPMCAICGGKLHGSVFTIPDGRTWCSFHGTEPLCSWCGILVPLGTKAPVLCRVCDASAVSRTKDIWAVKDELKRNMIQFGITVETPTKILLVDSTNALSGDPHSLGVTSWNRESNNKVSGPIVIKVLRGLPLPQFHRVLAHEFAHAAMADSDGIVSLGSRLTEGFAEALAIIHLRALKFDAIAVLEQSMLTNPDINYGDGLRLVLPAVERYGLRAVLVALRAARPKDVMLPSS